MKHIVLIVTLAILSMYIQAQGTINDIDSVIVLQEIPVFAKQGISVINSTKGTNTIHVSGKGKSSIVSKVTVKPSSTYRIYALEFYFNYIWKGFDGEGFLIKPKILSSENGLPSKNLLSSNKTYFIGNSVNEILTINLDDYDLVIKDNDSFFVGIDFLPANGINSYEDFNVTMVPLRKALNTSFIKGTCNNCNYAPFNIDSNNGISLKYNIYYK
ncbi:MAG: hypothetical protein ACOZDD_02900 [Bacteroidota bacterium]